MKKKIFVVCILGIFLLVSTATGLTSTTNQKNSDSNDNNDKEYIPVMKLDKKTLDAWKESYDNAERAFIDPKLVEEIQATEDYSILDLLSYIPEERTQGGCGNCWAWPATSILGIALNVQKDIFDRLSVQYINTCLELYDIEADFPIGCCEGGNLDIFTQFYSQTGIAIPWSNDNAHWQDYVIMDQCDQVNCNEISKTPNYPISYIIEEVINTHEVLEETAIENIKSILHQKRGVCFSVYFADDYDLYNFNNFWRNEDEESIYNISYYCGAELVENEYAGHAMLVVGYHDDENSNENDYWIVLNSWGTASGRPNGLLRIDMHMDYDCYYVYEGDGYYALYFETLDVSFDEPEWPDPPIIKGSSSGEPDEKYSFTISAKDRQDGDVYLYVNWGDGTNTSWEGPFDSEEEVIFSHTWDDDKKFTISAKARDIYDNESPWAVHQINLPRYKDKTTPLLNSLKNNFILYQLMQLLLQKL